MPDSPPPPTRPYRGRFAPSPTGPLHLGSLIAALASYLDARKNRGVWLVRIDDLDPPREEPGAADSILHSLQQHGLQWDEEVLWQSHRGPAYREALTLLDKRGMTFQCDCTRAMLGPGGACQNLCPTRQQKINTPSSIRIEVPAPCCIQFTDQLQGKQNIALGSNWGNFIVHRKDGLYAYQLAVVVDDAHQRITNIVRGSDLLDTTARQIFLQQALGYSTPEYCHVPVITNTLGQKFSKQNHAPALDNAVATTNLRTALDFLYQPPPPDELMRTGEILDFARHNWSLQRIPGVLSRCAES